MRPYFMGYKAGVAQSRLTAFLKEEMDVNDIIVFMQDCIEAELIPVLVSQVNEFFYDYALHYVEVGLCHAHPRALH